MSALPGGDEEADFLKDEDIPSIPIDEFCIYGTVYAFPEHADALERVYTEITRSTRDEPGTVYYCICRDNDQRHIFHFFERYTGKKAFDEHVNHPLTQRLLNEQKYIRGVKARFAKAL